MPARTGSPVPEPEDSELMGRILWGQHYRFLPSKPALRVLAGLCADGLPTLAVFKDRACEAAEAVGLSLAEKDRTLGKKFGEKFSTSFPEPEEKSRRRYRDQYLAYVRPTDGKVDGLLSRLKFIKIMAEGGTHKVGITKSGLDFAVLQNPVLDGAGNGSLLSDQEADFLIRHIRARIPEEARHMDMMLRLIGEGVASRERLNSRMGEFYRAYQDVDNPWTPAHVNTMRAGLLSRLYELGLVDKTKHGLNVTYWLTERGKKCQSSLRQ
ncbi:MAG: hypothetical protein QXT68_04355 [Halobacteria archaeon]